VDPLGRQFTCIVAAGRACLDRTQCAATRPGLHRPLPLTLPMRRPARLVHHRIPSPETCLKFKMAKNSLFSVLLRSRWWISLLIALVLGVAGFALLPASVRVVGALSGLPFVVIAVMAALRQRHLPSAARVAETQQALAAMPWPAFAALLEQALVRDGYTVQRGRQEPVDFELQRQGRQTLVSARRWKSARTGLEALRALQAAREASDAAEAIHIGLGAVSDNAQAFATEQRITVWQAAELAQALRGLALPAPAGR
jgi:restriction system protein